MTEAFIRPPDPALDLVLERVIDVPPALVWEVWTKPEHLKHWFTPKPWTVSHCEIDLRPGGICSTTMRAPDGTEYPNIGCYLEVVPNKRLVFTDALLPGFRPTGKGFMTAIISIEPHGTGTRYVATAIHADEAARKQHEEMGFMEGWGTTLTQLVEYAKTLG